MQMSKTKINHSIKNILFILLLIASISSLGQMQQKIDSLETLLKKTKQDTTKARLMNDLAYVYYSSNPEKTISLTNTAIALSKKINSPKNYLYGLYINGIGKSITMSNEEATKNAIFLISESSRLKNDFHKAQGHFLYAYHLRNKSKDIAALENFKMSLSLFKKEKSQPNIANVYGQLAFSYSKLSNYGIAIKYYLLASKMLKAQNQTEGYKSTINNLGETYLNIKNYPLALKYFKESSEIGKTLKNKIWIGNDNLSIAKLYIETNKPNQAKVYLKTALKIFKEIPYDSGLASTFNSLGKISKDENKILEAINYFKQALAINLKDKNEYYLIETYSNLGNSYQKLKQVKLAKSYYEKALTICVKYNFGQQKRDVFKQLSDLYSETNNYKESNNYLQQYETIKDSLLDEVKNNQIVTLQVEYDTEQKEIENKLLKQNNDIQKLTIEKQQQSTEIISIILASLIVLSLVLYWLFRSKKIANTKLEHKNDIIDTKNSILETTQQKLQQSLNEKEVLLKEIHHRVKNNLQLVNSLLSIQARNTSQGEELKEFLNKSQNRVQSMALIHETLYSSNNLSKVDFEKYVQKLTDHLLNSFDIEKENITTLINTNDIILDVETVIPLGLILTELINNSLKYAFPKGKGKIEISLQNFDDKNLDLIVFDNGIGLPANYSNKETTLGMQLVNDLTAQIEGKLLLDNSDGTKFTIRFPKQFDNKNLI
jgi:two-component system, sensor histidine kinase PdtaS